MNPKVCILAAGSGKRMGRYSEIINKALLPLNKKAIISHIIEKFPQNYEFVVAVGYLSYQVVDYLKIAHPKHHFTFVEVANYSGSGSGPGLSSLSCKKSLDCPFYFVSCDTIWKEDIRNFPIHKNWMAIAEINNDEAGNYCNVTMGDNQIVSLHDKKIVSDKISLSFTGLAFIRDFELFWQGLERSGLIADEKQVSDGFANIIAKSSIVGYKVNWIDVGTFDKYVCALKDHENYDFSKTNEFLYVFPERVIKFFKNREIVESRIKKARLHPAVFPKLEAQEGCFYSYFFQPGETLYKAAQADVFNELLIWLDRDVWIPESVQPEYLAGLCRNFYRDKSYDRIELYEKKYSEAGESEIINQIETPSARTLLESLNWENLYSGHAFFIHGDLQPDNILFDDNKRKFTLIDWRQDFAGEVEFGDIYYDFAKLLGGLRLNYDQVKLNNFQFREQGNSCEFTYPSHPEFQKTQQLLEDYILKKGYSVAKVRLLVGLIYLNMSPLHHYPFDRLLNAIGREIIFDCREKI